ncbi:MAG: T9SS type A sorting domain-containing protein [Bacteroidetes bacterium]|nr:T9SS type A sorting domain-containing protein [Bacteroidota bacterium]
MDVNKSVDGGFLLTGFYEDFTQSIEPCVLIKTNINGTELWRKIINKNVPNSNTGFSIVQDTNSKKIFIAGRQYIGNASAWDTYSHILILDSLGNNPIRKSFNNAGGGGFSNLIQLKDKNFLVGGQWSVNYNLGTYNAMLVKFDINGNVIWSTIFPEVNTGNVTGVSYELPNEDIIQLAFTDTANLLRRMEFIRLDKNGKIKTRKYIGSAQLLPPPNPYCTEAMPSLNPTMDKGFILSSWFPNKQTPRPYSILKLDSTGCDTTEQWCQSVALTVDNFKELTGYNFEMFPNPANDILHLELSGYAEKSIQINLQDISGNQIENLELEPNTKTQLNTSKYSSGFYFITISQNNSAIETRKLVIVR